MTSKVLLCGYKSLSDGAKITYQVIDSYDWLDKATGDSKGYAYPAVETLATIRGLSARTIERHIAELEGAGLVQRLRRCNRPSLLIINDVSSSEHAAYEATLVRGGEASDAVTAPRVPNEAQRPSHGSAMAGDDDGRGPMTTRANDISVGSAGERQTTKVSRAYTETKRTPEEQQHQQVVVERLKGLRVSQRKAEELGKHFAARYIEEKIRFLEWKLAGPGRGQHVADPAAWLVQAIVRDYQPPQSAAPATPQRHIRVIGFDEERNVAIVEEVEQAGGSAASNPAPFWQT
ncbi:MAG: helix-turn-helix domain-containing protein [Chloroflexota bacterium]|nr:helix-turn-helix domain-containing protein [Chloroflexota bacterium]